MNAVHHKVMIAYNDSNPKPSLITLSREDWHDMFNSFTRTVNNSYIVNGFYQVGRRKTRSSFTRRSKAINADTVNAFSFKGVAVVIDEDYRELMRGHRTSRIVLEV